jgi:hypothetical protein
MTLSFLSLSLSVLFPFGIYKSLFLFLSYFLTLVQLAGDICQIDVDDGE